MKTTATIYLGALFAMNLAFSIQCHKKPDGTFEFRENGDVVEPETFDCISVFKPRETTISITYLSDDNEGRKICQIQDDGHPKDKKIYSRSEVETGTRCRYTCKDSTGFFKCDSVTTKTDNACTCKPRPHTVLILPVSHETIGGQSDMAVGDDSCDGKPEGYQFPDPVPCVSMRGDIEKRRVDFIRDKPGMCRVETSVRQETRYIRASPDESKLQGCLSVCKKAGPRCITEEDNGKCECASPGLTKRLVAMDDFSVSDVIRQTDCTSEGCGPCGTCNKRTKACVLHRDAHLRDLCPCGERCPEVDMRGAEHRSGKILCQPNLSLECMKKPGWLASMFDKPDAGTRHPNLCTPGKSDSTDTCSCAPGYVEVPGPFSEMYCRKENESK